jgi:phosphomannomutase
MSARLRYLRLSAFIRANQRLSARARRKLSKPGLLAERYLERVATLMHERRPQVVVDVGGGRSCHFAASRLTGAGTRIVAVDADADELAVAMGGTATAGETSARAHRTKAVVKRARHLRINEPPRAKDPSYRVSFRFENQRDTDTFL